MSESDPETERGHGQSFASGAAVGFSDSSSDDGSEQSHLSRADSNFDIAAFTAAFTAEAKNEPSTFRASAFIPKNKKGTKSKTPNTSSVQRKSQKKSPTKEAQQRGSKKASPKSKTQTGKQENGGNADLRQGLLRLSEQMRKKPQTPASGTPSHGILKKKSKKSRGPVVDDDFVEIDYSYDVTALKAPEFEFKDSYSNLRLRSWSVTSFDSVTTDTKRAFAYHFLSKSPSDSKLPIAANAKALAKSIIRSRDLTIFKVRPKKVKKIKRNKMATETEDGETDDGNGGELGDVQIPRHIDSDHEDLDPYGPHDDFSDFYKQKAIELQKRKELAANQNSSMTTLGKIRSMASFTSINSGKLNPAKLHPPAFADNKLDDGRRSRKSKGSRKSTFSRLRRLSTIFTKPRSGTGGSIPTLIYVNSNTGTAGSRKNTTSSGNTDLSEESFDNDVESMKLKKKLQNRKPKVEARYVPGDMEWNAEKNMLVFKRIHKLPSGKRWRKEARDGRGAVVNKMPPSGSIPPGKAWSSRAFNGQGGIVNLPPKTMPRGMRWDEDERNGRGGLVLDTRKQEKEKKNKGKGKRSNKNKAITKSNRNIRSSKGKKKRRKDENDVNNVHEKLTVDLANLKKARQKIKEQEKEAKRQKQQQEEKTTSSALFEELNKESEEILAAVDKPAPEEEYSPPPTPPKTTRDTQEEENQDAIETETVIIDPVVELSKLEDTIEDSAKISSNDPEKSPKKPSSDVETPQTEEPGILQNQASLLTEATEASDFDVAGAKQLFASPAVKESSGDVESPENAESKVPLKVLDSLRDSELEGQPDFDVQEAKDAFINRTFPKPEPEEPTPVAPVVEDVKDTEPNPESNGTAEPALEASKEVPQIQEEVAQTAGQEQEESRLEEKEEEPVVEKELVRESDTRSQAKSVTSSVVSGARSSSSKKKKKVRLSFLNQTSTSVKEPEVEVHKKAGVKKGHVHRLSSVFENLSGKLDMSEETNEADVDEEDDVEEDTEPTAEELLP